MYKNVELRKLPAGALCNIINILEINDDWKYFMTKIPNSLQSKSTEPKYNSEHIRLIEEHAKATNQKCTEILLSEWSTSGRIRPSLNHMKNILIKAKMFRAADTIAEMLEEPYPPRETDGPEAPITTNVTDMLNDETMEQRLNRIGMSNVASYNDMNNKTTKQMNSSKNKTTRNSFGNDTTAQMKSQTDQTGPTDFIKFSKNQDPNVPDLNALEKPIINKNYVYNPNIYQTSFPNIDISLKIDTEILQDTKLINFEYEELKTITGNFSDVLINGPNGLQGRIGSGGFGDVFVGHHSKYGFLAVKKAHLHLLLQQSRKPDIAIELFNAEVKMLSQFRHNNIVPIIGFSKNGPMPCIVCEYIDGGSLQQNIAAKVLDESQRFKVMVGTAEGLKYLHTSKTPVESIDNSALRVIAEIDSQDSTRNFVHRDVKSANILLTTDCVPKLCDFGLAKQYTSTFMTTCPLGTSAYMAPEGINGTITQKIDIFSYGIVLLELLTGLPPIIATNKGNFNIRLYIAENTVKHDIGPLLDSPVKTWQKANNIFELAQKCLESDRNNRPDITEICETFDAIKSNS